MTCIVTLRRALVRLGLYPNPTEVEVKEAETENLEHDRSQVMTELVQKSTTFKERSGDLEATTEQRKDDLTQLLGHISNINASTKAARMIIERMFNHPMVDENDGSFR